RDRGMGAGPARPRPTARARSVRRAGPGLPPADETDCRAPALARHLRRLASTVGLRRRPRAPAVPAPRRARLLPRGRDPALVAGLPGRAAPLEFRRQVGLSRGGVRLRVAARPPALPPRPADLPV